MVSKSCFGFTKLAFCARNGKKKALFVVYFNDFFLI